MSSRIVLHLAGSSSDSAIAPGEVDKDAKRSGEFEPKPSNGPPRRSVKWNALARGLARQYDAQKAREDAYKARLPRQLEQKERAQSQTKNGGYDRRSGSPVRNNESPSGSNSDANENGVILRLGSRPKASSISSSRQGKSQYKRARNPGGDSIRTTSRSRTLVVPVRHGLGFSRKAGLRREVAFPTNQSDDARVAEDGGSVVDGDVSGASVFPLKLMTSAELALSSPVILRPSHRGSSSVLATGTSVAAPPIHHQQPVGSGGGGSMSHWRPDRSSALVLCELRVAKEIMAREQALRQLGEAAGAFDNIASELIEAVEAKKTAEAAAGAGAARMFRLRRGSSSSVTLLRPDSGSQTQSNAAAMAALKLNVAALSTTVDKLTEKIRQRAKQIESLIENLREATTTIVEGVAEWRDLQRRRRACSNFDPLLRFPWKNGKVANYVLHLQTDTRALFSSTAIMCLLGADAEFKALLLPRSVLSTVRQHKEAEGTVVSPYKTFLTDKVESTATVAAGAVGNRTPSTVPVFDQHLYYALMAALPRLRAAPNDAAEPMECSTPEDLARWRLSLELIAHELEVEKRDCERCEQDAERLQRSYNPFHAIKAVGGVDEQFSTLLAEQSPHVEKLRQQLRHRQQDATDYITSADASDRGSAALIFATMGDTDAARATIRSDRRLHISTHRLHNELQRRRDMSEAAMRCETRDAVFDFAPADSVGIKRNRLQGKVLVRKQPVPTMSREDRLASVIQRQFRAYRARGDVLQSLTGLVGIVRESTVNIQRVYRGHIVKLRFQDVLTRRNELRRKRMRAARTIVLAFRRYKRRQRHRQSITVVAIAQAQLQSMLVSKSQDTDDASAMKKEETERLRRLGAERRRHRAAMMEQQRRERLALEAKQTAAAIRIQSIIRSQLAQRAANVLRQEKKAHIAAVSAITIQSGIRTFLVRQEARRLRFRKDLERVNRSAERIQRVYRDYNLRVHETPIEAVDEADESLDDEREGEVPSEGDQWDGKLPQLLQHSTSQPDSKSGPPTAERVALPPLTRSTASSMASRRPSRQLTTPPTPAAATTVAMTRIELKLKEPVIDFQGLSSGSNSARRGSFQGWHGRA